MNYRQKEAEERRSTTDLKGNSLVEVEEEVRVVPPSHLLKEQGCALTGGGFLKAINRFLDDYYEGKVVLGRIRSAKPIDWDQELCDRSPYQFFMENPVIVYRSQVMKLKLISKK